MNDVLKTILERYSCRDFLPDPISAEQLNALVDAALAAPSAINLQPWHIIAVTDKALIDEMDAAAMASAAKTEAWYARIMERGGRIFYNAPCMIIIAKNDSDMAPLDCGIVVQNIALAAHSLGLGNVICGMARIPLTGANADKFLPRLKFPPGYSFATSILIGHANSGKAPHDLDKSKVTYIS